MRSNSAAPMASQSCGSDCSSIQGASGRSSMILGMRGVLGWRGRRGAVRDGFCGITAIVVPGGRYGWRSIRRALFVEQAFQVATHVHSGALVAESRRNAWLWRFRRIDEPRSSNGSAMCRLGRSWPCPRQPVRRADSLLEERANCPADRYFAFGLPYFALNEALPIWFALIMKPASAPAASGGRSSLSVFSAYTVKM